MSKNTSFSTPVDSSTYISGGDTSAPGFALKSIDYDQGVYVFQLLNSDGSTSPQVNGVTVAPNSDGTPAVSEANAAADIRAAIAATNS